MTQNISKMRCDSPHSIPNTNRENGKVEGDFYALQKHELLALREAKLINNSGFVHLALRLENPYCDRDIEIIPKEFASRWNIPQSSVYEALGKLEAAGAINIKSGKVIIEWSNSQQKDDSGNPENLQKPRIDSGNPERILETQNELRKPRMDSGNPENRPLEPAPAKDFNSLRLIQNIQTNQTLSEANPFDEFFANLDMREREGFLDFARMKTFGFKQRIVSLTDWLKADNTRFLEFKTEWEHLERKNSVATMIPPVTVEQSNNVVKLPLSPAQRLEQYCDRLKEDWGQVKFRKLVSIYPSGFYLDVAGSATLFNIDALERLTPEQLEAIANGEGS
ncbi:hypothetical protein [Limnoraphis robusta]|uniref:hypothetical protein n=1 Tax=Limnoraphis robusta TaxID=1118279 RepID=UPI002B21FF2B|nr:hypothetical protein [Limnoraphis robusta]MEA5498012.1 hypothetical protein [Limnoraphis robusta BA-68 BA1]